MSWINFFDKTVARFPHKTALIDQKTTKRWTYTQLQEEIKKTASFLIEQNVEKGDRIVFINTNCLEHITLFMACARLGAIFVPMNWRLGNVEKEEIILQVKPKLIIILNECELNLEGHNFVNLSNIDISLIQQKNNRIDSNLDDPLLMLFTSGSTGTPKGVLLHGEMLLSNQTQTIAGWGLKSCDITIVETPFFHTGGYNVLLLPLLKLGGTIVLAEKFDCQNFFNTVQQEKISVYFGVPTMFQQIAMTKRFHSEKLTSLRFLISGGAYCPVELIKTYQAKGLNFKQGFGLTEVGPNCFLLEQDDALRKVGSIGKPMPHSQVLLINENQEVPNGIIGELVIKGPHVCAGYFNDQSRFKNSLHGDYFKTGDLGVCDEEGFYFIVGRIKDMYISGGENVYPAEV
ncbi:MAG: AMP-binding protein, partial [Halobacteriovoraceae bacterium]|nr:AMP-binding protein [Halobacteriovoraceae bacterium]